MQKIAGVILTFIMHILNLQAQDKGYLLGYLSTPAGDEFSAPCVEGIIEYAIPGGTTLRLFSESGTSVPVSIWKGTGKIEIIENPGDYDKSDGNSANDRFSAAVWMVD